MYLKRRVEEGGHDVPIKKLLERRVRGIKNIKKSLNLADCLIFIDNSLINRPPMIVKSLYKNQLCFINEIFERNISWLDEIIDEDIAFISKEKIPKEHMGIMFSYCFYY